MSGAPREERITVAPGVGLHVERRAGDPGRAVFVLVHGLASNLRLWDGVAESLQARGHSVVAVDQRGHGRSDAPADGYDLETAVADLQAVVRALNLVRPVLAGQSWGGNVVLELGCRAPEEIRGIACVDGGLIELADWFPSWEACLAALTPPTLDHLTVAELESRLRISHADFPYWAVGAFLACFHVRPDGTVAPRLARAHHLRILRSLWEHRPSARFASLRAPTLLALADTGDAQSTARKRRAETAARAVAPRLRSRWFVPAHHDLHAQKPEEIAALMADAVTEGFFA